MGVVAKTLAWFRIDVVQPHHVTLRLEVPYKNEKTQE